MSTGTAQAPAPAEPARDRHLLRAALIALALIAVAAGATLAVLLRGGGTQNTAELGQQRAGLVLVADELLTVREPVAREVAAARAVWPQLAGGIPAHPSRELLARLRRASSAAEEVPTPRTVNLLQELTGPAPRIAKLFHNFQLLARNGFAHTAEDVEAIMHGSGPAASFAKRTANLYISSIYDGNFNLSLIGEKVMDSYERLGAEAEFGSALTDSQVESIVSAYSQQADVLAPHDFRALRLQQ